MIVPSIDLMGGKAVQLRRGKEKVLEVEDVFALAERFARFGDLAVIDLDAALGQGSNDALVRELCRRHPCRVGGGIRTPGRAIELIKAGARKVIIGTAALPSFLEQLPRTQVMVALDIRGDRVLSHGWTRETGRTVVELAREIAPYASGFLCTIVDREGMLAGTDLARLRAVRDATPLPVTAAGGITTADEVSALHDAGMDAQLGMAIYTGALDLVDLVVTITDFQKTSGLVPTIVRDDAGRVRLLAFSSVDSLRAALTTGRGIYFSRRRGTLWTKGETSGHTQRLLRVDLDCDRDTLLFTVEQTGPACHRGTDSCFGEAPPPFLEALYETVRQRIASAPPGSYSARLAADPALLIDKIREEAEEVCTARGREALRWEVADLLYHVTVLMAREDLTFEEVAAELAARRR